MNDLKGIQPHEMAHWWPLAAPLVAQAIERTPYWTLDDVRRTIASGSRQLWVLVPGIEAVLVTEIMLYSTGRRLQLFACAGELPADWTEHLGRVEAWARKNDCRGIDLNGRRGWARKLLQCGYVPTHAVMSKELADVRQ